MLFVNCRRHRVRRYSLVGRAGCGRDLSQTKVQNLRVSALGNKDVGGLYIAVDDPSGMSSIECVGDVNRRAEQKQSVVDGLSGDAIFQRHPVQKLHGDERFPILLTDVKDHANIGVIQRGGGLGFALKTGEGLRVPGRFFRQELRATKRWRRMSSAL